MMITLQVVCYILFISKKLKNNGCKQKALDADSRAIQQTIFTGYTDAQIRFYYILEQSKETILEFSKGTTKVL